MSQGKGSVSTGAGFPGLLAILFIALKLMGHIDWSWWWVLSPLWIGAGVVIVILALWIVVVALLARL